ncbi:glycosyltransferase family protein [Paludibaculum fermentans]|uniref:Glycosyl transferase family 2 n=1 Tax=Paludibaculum fermentans TaxID=1473598 RepID=A0A7S7NX32_PALFE|nr:glycosyl transferase family 2 [Paludibaculum fermentans]QOY91354.1 glycosyl transferase family 2 [Paludibaculum fermentans]
MAKIVIPDSAQAALKELRTADIVVGIPSYNNARTIGHVVQAAHAGLLKYFPQFTAVIVNSDGGSSDGTRDVVLSSSMQDSRLLMLSTPVKPVNRLSLPYHGIPGKGSAFRLIFQIASTLGAKACAVVDSDLRSITPEWIDLLLRPVVHAEYDFVAPYYHRHKYDGTITNSIVYPLTRALYGHRLRQPIGGDFGVSLPLLRRYLERDDWETDVARYGIDIWMTTVAVAEGFRVCQSFLGAKLHDAKDPGSDLSAMLMQVVGSVFTLMQEYESAWTRISGSQDIDLFGFRYDVGLDPIEVNLDRMLVSFRRGCEELKEVWQLALSPETLEEIDALAAATAVPSTFHIADELWVRLIFEFACAHHKRRLDRGTLLRSLTPLYLGRVASFVIETRDLTAPEVDQRVENLCLTFEALKPRLVAQWSGIPSPAPKSAPEAALAQHVAAGQKELEV